MNEIEISNLFFSYPHEKEKRTVLKDISFTLSQNENVGLIGANGVGKSTLLKLLVGLLTVEQGTIKIEEQLVEKKHLKEIRAKIGYVFQDSDSQLFMPTVYQDVAFAPENYGYPKEEVKRRTMEALLKVGMEAYQSRPIYSLSGGEKKLVSMATILSMEPGVILLDEPSVALDPRNRRRLIGIIKGMEGAKLIASHDLDFIYDTCERTIFLSGGEILADGDTKEILQNKELLEKNGLELPLSLSRR